MGWKEGEGIGGFKKEVVKSIEPVVRPKGLGLGASIKKNKEKGAKEGEEELNFKKGAFVLIEGGNKKGQYGEVEGLDEENGRVFIRLALGGTTSAFESIVRVVTKKEFKENGKVVNLDKYQKYKRDREEKEERSSRRSRSGDRDDGRRRKGDRHTRGSSRSRSRSPECKKAKYKSEKNGARGRGGGGGGTWVRPQLRVRCIDKKLKDGRYYKAKVSRSFMAGSAFA